jgi:hypothetical protein
MGERPLVTRTKMRFVIGDIGDAEKSIVNARGSPRETLVRLYGS